MRVLTLTSVAVVAVVVTFQIAPRAQQVGQETSATRSAPVFTVAQAALGQTAYGANCAQCHGPSLNDGAFGPPLKGVPFIQKYGGRSVESLFRLTSTTMPTTAPGSLGPTVYAQIVAYILQQNAIVPGTRGTAIRSRAPCSDDHSAGRLQFHGVLTLRGDRAQGHASQPARQVHPCD